MAVTAVPLVEVEDVHHAVQAAPFGKGVGEGSRHRLGEPQRIAVGRLLGIETFERELGEDGDVGSLSGGGVDGGEPARDVVSFVGRGVLLDEREFHEEDFTLSLRFLRLRRHEGRFG